MGSLVEATTVWAVLGLALIGAEMLVGTFYIIWFGLAALMLALWMWLLPDSLSAAAQIGLFALFSLAFLALWKQYDKKTAKPELRVGQAQGEEIGRIGTMTEAASAMQNGRIQFAQGVMGSRDWVAISDEALEIGQQAALVRVEGNRLRVKAV